MKNLNKHQRLRHHFLYMSTYNYPEEKRWEFAKSYLKEMCVTKFKFDLKEKIDGTYALSIAGNKGVHDITALNNLPISELDASNTDIGDILATESMPLKKINISHTHVYSIQSLEGKAIREINIWMTNIRNLKFISQAPLEIIHLNNKWSDLNYLANIKELKKIYLSRFTFNELILQKIKDIRGTELELIFID